MKPDEQLHELYETIDAVHEIQEIDKVICCHLNSPYFDRFNAQVIIQKYLDTDPYVKAANSVLPNHVPME